MTISRRKETPVKKVFQHRVADIRGGVGVRTADLGGEYLFEGTPLGPAEDGLCSVVKYARASAPAAATATAIEVEKGHHFKVGDVVSPGEKAKAHAITAIDRTAAAKDTVTVGAALGAAIAAGGFIVEAAAEATGNTSALKTAPQSLCGTGHRVAPGDNIHTDAWLIGTTKGNDLPACIADRLKGITNI